MKKNIFNLMALVLVAFTLSACGSGSSGGDGATTGGGNPFDPNQLTGNQNMSFDCLETSYNPETDTNGVHNGGNYTYDAACNTAGTGTLVINQTITLTVHGYINGTQANDAYDVLTFSVGSDRGFFDGGSTDFVATLHLDASGNGSITFVPTFTGTTVVTIKSTLMENSGVPAEVSYDTTTLTFTVQN
jgi:hypothetical protein